MLKYDVSEQGTPEWFAARMGIPTASAFDKIITPTGKTSTQADSYANELLADIMAGEPLGEDFDGNKWTQRGKDLEAEAALSYELASDEPVEKVGFITDDKRTMGASPDRLVGTNGLLEIKVVAPKHHVAALLKSDIEQDYRPQLQGQLLVAEREWVDLLSYHPKIPRMTLRVYRNEKYISEMVRLLNIFNETMHEKKILLIQKGYMKGVI